MMDSAPNLCILVVALVVEAAVGYPDTVFRLIRHPVVWIGAAIAGLDTALNRDTMPDARRRRNGALAVTLVVLAAALPAALVQAALLRLLPAVPAIVLSGLAASSLLAQRSLFAHVRAVACGLEREGLDGGRAAVARIVGRNPAMLDEAAVARAAIESLAENFSDGVVAPALWCLLLGLPGIAAYKAINTADSMIGHRSPRHEAFGWAAARLDDLVNLPASRLAAAWLVLAALLVPRARAGEALMTIRRDAGKHRSPNAGWPEAAMAGALGLKLAGPRIYGTALVEDPWLGSGNQAAGAADIRRALVLYRAACIIELAAVCLIALAILIWRA